MLFEKIDVAQELKLSKSWGYLGSWNTLKTEGLYFGPKRISHSVPRYLISYDLWPSFVTTCNWSNIWITDDSFFPDQNITPRFLRCSSFTNILMILTILVLALYQFFRKSSVMTVATLTMKLYKYHCISVSCFWQPEGHFQGQTVLPAVICYRMIQNFTCTSDWMVFRHSKFAVWLRWFGDDTGLGLVQYHKSDCHPDSPKIWYHTLTMEKMHVAKFNHLFSSLCE